jgi:predicted lipoprotein with Yx(FWY)xxD motif
MEGDNREIRSPEIDFVSIPKEKSYKGVSFIAFVFVAVTFSYFVFTFLLSERDRGLTFGDAIKQVDGMVQEEKALTNEEITPDTEMQKWLVPELNTDVLNTRISYEYGRILAEPKRGIALYVNTKDECSGSCLETWIPYEAPVPIDEGALATIQRKDTGTYQYTWNGDKLYRYKLDTSEKNMQGNGVDGIWKFARP